MKKKKAVAGEGCLVEKRPGYYEYRISYRDMFGNRKIKSFGGKDIDELYIRADEFRHDLSEMQRGVQVDATIPEILRRRYEYDFAKNYTQEPGYYRNMDSLKIIERSPIGKIPIRDLEKEDIERFLISIVKYSNSVIGKTFGQLKLAYREAISSEIITKNLMDNKDIRRPKSKKRSRKVSAFTREEQQIFLDVMRKHRVPKNRNDYRKQLLIELYTGMRMGEINALRPEDIDLANNVIHVNGTISKGIDNRSFRKDHTKTDAGIRDVPIADTVRPILEEALREMRENPEHTVFYDYIKGDVISTTQVCYFFRRICAKGGLKYHGQHALRHTFATRCIEAGVQPVVLKKWLGHTNIHVTLDTYSDVFDKLNNDSINVFDYYLKNTDCTV